MEPECSHHWQDCPVHNPDGGMPSMITVTTCLYGGLGLKTGETWDDDTSREVWERVFKKLLG